MSPPVASDEVRRNLGPIIQDESAALSNAADEEAAALESEGQHGQVLAQERPLFCVERKRAAVTAFAELSAVERKSFCHHEDVFFAFFECIDADTIYAAISPQKRAELGRLCAEVSVQSR